MQLACQPAASAMQVHAGHACRCHPARADSIQSALPAALHCAAGLRNSLDGACPCGCPCDYPWASPCLTSKHSCFDSDAMTLQCVSGKHANCWYMLCWRAVCYAMTRLSVTMRLMLWHSIYKAAVIMACTMCIQIVLLS